MARYVDKTLAEYGYGGVETQLNEWNNAPSRAERGSSVAAARAAAMMIAQQRERTSLMCYYDARVGSSVYGGLFNPITFGPFCAYYAFYAFGALYALGTETACACDAPGVYAMAAAGGADRAVLVANTNGEAVTLKADLPGDLRLYLIDSGHMLAEAPRTGDALTLAGYQTALLTSAPVSA